MAKGKFQSVDSYEADVLALLDKAEKNLAPDDYVDLLNNLSQSIDHKHDQAVNELRQADIEEIEDYAGSTAPHGH